MHTPGKVRFEDFEADLSAGELRKHGFRIRLQEKPFQVLAAILERPGQLITREKLHQRLWGAETFVDFDNNLNTAVYRLREALGDTAETPRFIETLPKKGYRFMASTIVADAAASADEAGSAPRTRAWRVALASSVLSLALGGAAYLAFNAGSAAALANSSNPQARESFLKGQYLLEKSGVENAQRAARFFEEAIVADPQFARAHAALATALTASSTLRRESVTRAKAAAARAIALDASLAEAHHRLASLYVYDDWDWAAAGEWFERAVRLAPDSATIHHSYAGFFSLMGEHERALAEMQRALQLDPVSVAVSADTGWYWFVARRYDEAIAQSKKALELDGQHRGAHSYIVLALQAKGETGDARAWAVKYLALLGGSKEELARVSDVAAAAGLRAFWQIRLDRALTRAKSERVPAQEIVLLYAALGESANALAFLEKSYDEHSGWLLPFMRVYPPLDALRTHPRFLAVQKRMNFPGRGAKK